MPTTTPEPPYVAVIFTSVRAAQRDDADYSAEAVRMEQMAATRPGYLGIESARGSDGEGITVSYWKDRSSAAAWKRDADHLGAQRMGRDRWYLDYRVRIATVHEEYGMVATSTGPEQAEQGVRAAYDEVADSYADILRTTEAEAPIDLAMIGYFVSLLAPERSVLDAGCGAGRLLPVLAGLGCEAEGVDLSPEMIRRAHEDHPEFETRVASLTALPYPDASFDGVLSWYSTIHTTMPELTRAATELRRVLRPEGVALIAFQRGRGVRDVADTYRAYGHEVVLERYLRTVDDMAAVLAAAGLTEVARLDRAATARHERDAQAFLVVQVQ